MTGNTTESTAPDFAGSLLGATTDTFAYNPYDATASIPDLVYDSGGGNNAYHASGNGVATLVYDLSYTTTIRDDVLVVDLWGRDSFQNRDDDFDVTLYTGTTAATAAGGGTSLGSVTNLAIPDVTNAYVRANFFLGTGVNVTRIEITARDSDTMPATSNDFVLQELRFAAIPEPSSALLVSVAGLGLMLRRRRRQ